LPPNKREDLNAFEELIELDHAGNLKIIIPISTTMVEEAGAGGDKREKVREKMRSAWRLWTVCISPEMNPDIDRRAECLKRIMQDKDGIDSRNIIVSTIDTPYYLTTDYRYIRQFKAQIERIKSLCKINVCVLSPSEFLKMYKNGKV
jgi:hypothetical protein